MKDILKPMGVILSAILPIATFIHYMGVNDFFIYDILWCGFYGCILVSIFCKSKIYKGVIIILNALFFFL